MIKWQENKNFCHQDKYIFSDTMYKLSCNFQYIFYNVGLGLGVILLKRLEFRPISFDKAR